MAASDRERALRGALAEGMVIPAHPLALKRPMHRRFLEEPAVVGAEQGERKGVGARQVGEPGRHVHAGADLDGARTTGELEPDEVRLFLLGCALQPPHQDLARREPADQHLAGADGRPSIPVRPELKLFADEREKDALRRAVVGLGGEPSGTFGGKRVRHRPAPFPLSPCQSL